MKTKFFLFVFLTALCGSIHAQTNISMDNGYYFINGKKFFIKGVGYEPGAYPGMIPANRAFNEEVLSHDLQRIVEAGFNTIRTWDKLTEKELQVVKKYNLKVIMGIWIDPGGDFASSTFISSAKQYVQNVLSYSKNYDNIIGYLIMNEPLTDHIFKIGYQKTVSLWSQLIDVIHQQHPGIPVSIAKTCTDDFINTQIFDFSAYNVYPYSTSVVRQSHQYSEYIRALKNMAVTKPLVITEYGLSVSAKGAGNWGYGGNTEAEQANAIMYMYRSLIDGGATGSCVFNYSDGWWKGGNASVHDDLEEEWFGLIKYTSLDDKYGVARPVWDSLKIYNRAIVTEPKNQEIYENQLPIEIFSEDTVFRVKIQIDTIEYIDTFENGYFKDIITLKVDSFKDLNVRLIFENSNLEVVKSESINCLLVKKAIELPILNIVVNPIPKKGDTKIKAIFKLIDHSPLSTGSSLDYAFYSHVGWEFGSSGTNTFNPIDTSVTRYVSLLSNYNLITVAGGVDASFGSFRKRIANYKTFIITDTSDVNTGMQIKEINPVSSFLFPNPANKVINLFSNGKEIKGYCITDMNGKVIQTERGKIANTIDVLDLSEGCYVIYYHTQDQYYFAKFLVEK